MRTAQHEAAHVVVGCALGLRLRRATAEETPTDLGWCQFEGTTRWVALGTMYAAGVAWELVSDGDLVWARVDRRLARWALRHAGGRADVRTAVACADALLRSRMGLHARVARLLAERDITGADVRAIVERSAG